MAEWERRGGVNKKRKAVLCDARARVRSAEGEKMEAGGEMYFFGKKGRGKTLFIKNAKYYQII